MQLSTTPWRWGNRDVAPPSLTPASDGGEWGERSVSRPCHFTPRDIALQKYFHLRLIVFVSRKLAWDIRMIFELMTTKAIITWRSVTQQTPVAWQSNPKLFVLSPVVTHSKKQVPQSAYLSSELVFMSVNLRDRYVIKMWVLSLILQASVATAQSDTTRPESRIIGSFFFPLSAFKL
jgi:hypothetical protein